ncbi:bifunctional metallophosphatase/5'-nucleotidase [Pararhodonellum marinum]|uniref:bifunctional metallophosphatase/5'-nucleotidase n=1 Tax=Pararhodonellum marinum TaxID=2755358 RepID=UPI001890867B|nr:metallophosphoesterase [Pararhodonellum marinum]
MENRRKFLKNLVVGSSALICAPTLWSGETFAASSKKITILHTNDTHSRIEPFPDDGSRNANQGGVAARATLIEKIRLEEDNVLLLDAGDIFQGTPYFNFYGGEIELKLMSKMGYDASTLGNHEFDNGLEGLFEQLEHAKFPLINSNYDFSTTLLRNEFPPYKVFKKGGIKVGVFGLGIELEGLVADKHYGGTRYLDPVGIAMEMVEELKSQKCQLIICLSHLGYAYQSEKIDDLKLAAQVSGIDLIIGGHTHTFLDEPIAVQHADGNITLVNQVGWAGIKMGKVDFVFDKDGRINNLSSSSILINRKDK